jgi:hypothetical protein
MAMKCAIRRSPAMVLQLTKGRPGPHHGFFDAGDRLQLWKRILPAIAAIVAEYGVFLRHGNGIHSFYIWFDMGCFGTDVQCR